MRKLYLMFLLALFTWALPVQEANGQYCSPSFSTGCSDGDGLTSFALGTINQSIPCVTAINNFTSQTTSVVPGTTYTVSVTSGYSSNYYSIWVDLNSNNTFDAAELLASGVCSVSGTVYTSNLTIPASTTPGNKRLRAICNYNSAPTDPCGTSYTFGNSSDFTLAVGSLSACDLQAYSWDLPNLNSNDLTASETVKVSVKNLGTAPQSGFTVAYSINGGTSYVTETVSATIQPGATYQHTFATNANFSAAGVYQVGFAVGLACDTVAVSNNIFTATLANASSISTFPFYSNFEGAGATLGWSTGGTNNSWEWGVPTASIINSAASPSNAWATNLDGAHNNNESSWVKSPFFNFTNLTAPIVEFKLWTNTQVANDAVALQYSIDGGTTWKHVGLEFSPTPVDPNNENWYNGVSITGLGYRNGWEGNTNGYMSVKYRLYAQNTVDHTNLAGKPSVLFRLWFGSDASTTNNGVAFDDFQVYQAPNNDIGIVGLIGLNNICAGSIPVSAQIKNFGISTLNTATVNWTVNGVAQPPVTYTGPLTANSSDTVELGNYTFVDATTYVVKAWTSLPNGVQDEIIFNDTSTTSGFQTSLNGTFTIGATGYYPTIAAAITALQQYGICGPVVFNLESGTYTNQVTIPQIAGSSATNTITFQSATGNASDVTVQFNSTLSTANWVWKHNGADYVKVKNMTIKSTTISGYGHVVELANNSDYNTFENCSLISVSSTSSTTTPVYIYNTGNDYNVFDGCYLQYGYYGVYAYGYNANTNGLQIKNSQIVDYYYYGVYNGYQINSTIENCFIKQSTTNQSTTHYPLYNYYSPGTRIVGNTILETNGTYNYGIYNYYSVSTAANWCLIANNMVVSNGVTTGNYGIRNLYSPYTKIFNNSVHMSGAATTNYTVEMTGSAAQGGPIQLKNNSFVNNSGGFVYYISEAVFLNNFVSSNNNLYKSASTNPLVRIVASPNVDAAALSNWQVYAPNDLLSLGDVYLSSTDLHSNSPYLNAAGTPLAEVTTDIDGDLRNATTPDIGCDEYTLPPYDLSAQSIYTLGELAIGSGDNHVVYARIFNAGTDTQYNKTATLTITGANTTTLTANIDTIVAFTSKVIAFPAVSFTNIGYNNLTLSVDADGNNTNNTLTRVQTVNVSNLNYADTTAMFAAIGDNDADGHVYWSKYYINGNYSVNSIRAFIPNLAVNVGKTIRGVVRNSSNVNLATTDLYTIAAADLGTYKVLSFANPGILTFNNENIYIGLIQPANTGTAYSPLGYQLENPLRSGIFFTSATSNGITLVPETQNRRFMLGVTLSQVLDFEASLDSYTLPAATCSMGLLPITVTIKNNGIDTLTTFDLGYQVLGSANQVVETVTGVSVLPYTTYSYTFSTLCDFSHTLQYDSVFTINMWVDLANDPLPLNDMLTGTVTSPFTPAAPITQDVVIVQNSPATLTATSPFMIQWFETPTGGTAIATGSTFTTPILADTTTYYVQANDMTLINSQVGTGTLATSYNPLYGLYDYSWSSQIYLASEMNIPAGNITSIQFFVNNSPSNYTTIGQKVFIKHTTATAFTDGSYPDVSTMTQVFDATIIWTGTGWREIVFNTPFVYNGVDNLEIVWQNWDGSYVSGYPTFNYTTSTNRAKYKYADVAFPTSAGTLTSNRPNIKFYGLTQNCVSERIPVTVYTILPPYDAELLEVTNPVGGCGLSVENITVNIKNRGSEPITTINFAYQVDNNTPVVETLSNANIALDSIYTYVFNTSFDFTAAVDTSFEILAWISMNGDTLNYNDTLFLTIESLFTPPAPTVFNNTAIEGFNTTLSVESDYIVTWYDNPNGGTAIATLDTFFVTPALYDTTSYWVSASVGQVGTLNISAGGGTYDGTIANPFGQFYWSGQSQFILLASDLHAYGLLAGTIYNLALNVSSPAGAALQNYSVSLGHTTANQMSAANYLTSGLTTVYSTSSYSSAPGWNLFQFTTPFNWNGIDNLVVQFCFSNNGYSSNAALFGSNKTYPVAYGFYGDVSATCGNTSVFTYGYGTSTFLPEMKVNAMIPGCESELVEIIAYVVKPDNDAVIGSMIAPVEACGTGVEALSFSMSNHGLNPITTFDFSYSVNGGTPVTETVTGVNILSDSSYVYTFAATYDFTALTADSTFTIDAWVTLLNDTINVNDSLFTTFNSLFQPADPIVNNATVVFGNAATLNATANGIVNWYNDPNGVNQVGTGLSFTTPVLFDTANYWVSASSGNPFNTLTTNFASNNSFAGNMFNITAYNTLTIDSFDINISSNDIAEVWYRQGSYVGYTNSNAGWTLLGSYSVTSNGYNTPTRLPIGGLTIPAGQTYGIYVTLQVGTMNYTNGDGTNEVVTNADMQFAGGHGGGYFNLTNSPRIWNGNIYYSTGGGCNSSLVPVQVDVTNIPAYDAGVIAAISPVSAAELTMETVSVTLQNLGTNPVSNFPITVEVSNGTNITEFVTQTIAPGGTINFTFNTEIDLSDFITYDICVYTQLSTDQYAQNDTLCFQVTNSPLIYCASNATSTAYEEIVGFGIGTAYNSSAPASGVAYTNFTANGPLTTLAAGMSYPVTVVTDLPPGYTYPSYSCYVKIFIDWNHDGVYNPVTELAWGAATLSQNTVNGTITVPFTAVPGTHGCRVVFVETSSATGVNPCGTYTWGETEDYLITVAPPAPYDAAVTAITSPAGTLVENDPMTVTISVFNVGTETISNFPVYYSINGGTPVSYTFIDTLTSFQNASVSFPTALTPGGYFDICAFPGLVGDTTTYNDTTCITLFALPQFDLEMVEMLSPVDGCDIGMADVTVVFENNGDTITDGITLGYIHDQLGAPVTELYSDTIYPGDVLTYTFNTQVNLTVTVDTEFDFEVFVSYAPDPLYQNDTASVIVESFNSPANPVVNNQTIFANQSATLDVINPNLSLFYNWYTTDTVMFYSGASYTTPNLFDTVTYYIESSTGSDQSVTIGNGTLTSYYVPAYGFYDYGWSSSIYKQAEIGVPMEITSIWYYVSNAVNYTLTDQKMFMRNTPTASFTSSIYPGFASMTLVFDNDITYTGPGWYEIVLADPFYYDGLGNLEIAWQNYDGIYSSGYPTFASTSVPGGAIYAYQDVSYPTYTGTITSTRPNIKIDGIQPGCESELVPVTVNVQYADFDGQVVDIVSPITGSYLTTAPVAAIIYNNGLNAISNFQAQYTVNGGNMVSETVTATILPGDSIVFTFTTNVNLSIFGVYDICVTVNVPNDGFALNNTLCEEVENMNGDGITCATAFPYGAVNDPAINSATLYAYDFDWWSFEVVNPMESVTISLCGSSFDTQLSYWLSCTDANYTAYNDDYCGDQSQITLNTGYLTPGTYYVRVYAYSSGYGAYTLNITGTAADKFTINLTGTNVACNGDATGSIQTALTAGPTGTTASLPVTYSWAPSGQTTANINGLIAGTYTVTVTDATGWSQTETIVITESAPIVVSGVTVDNTVIGGNIGSVDVTVTGGNTPYAYYWGNNATTQDIMNAYAGIYNLTVTDALACVETATFPVNSPSPFTVTPTSIQHLIVIPQNALITLDGAAVAPGSFVAVFYDSAGVQKCGGWAYWSGMATTLVAYGQTAGQDNGFAPNETFSWRVYNSLNGANYGGTATYNTQMYPHNSTFQIGGLSGVSKVEAFSIITQTINLPEGWSIWSTYINPTYPNIASVLSAIAPVNNPASPVIICKNDAGAIFWPVYNLNLIGNVVIGKGYQIKIGTTGGTGTSFGVTGLKLDPTTSFSISTGWSLIAYLRTAPANVATMLASIAPVLTPTSCTEIVKNGSGNIFWPIYNLNTIGNMIPGQGYQLKNKCSALTFSYPAGGAKAEGTSYSEPRHFRGVENTGNNMTLGIDVNAWKVEPMIGDEIGVFDASGKLIGSSVYEGGFTAVTIWGKETIDPSEKGSDGSKYTVRFWQSSTDVEMELVINSWEQGSDAYVTNGIAVASKVTIAGNFADTFVLSQNMPNPFNSSTIIPFYVPVDCFVNLAVYNSLGQKITDIYNEYVSAGKYEVTFDAALLPAGTYYYKLVSEQFVGVKAMTIE